MNRSFFAQLLVVRMPSKPMNYFIFIFFCFLLTLGAIQVQAQGKQITGKVLDAATKEPIPFAGIYVKGANNYGTTSNESGNFVLMVPNTAAALEVSSISFTTQEVLLNDKTDLTVHLVADALRLEETVVIGYQTRVKSTLTGSVKALDGGFAQDKPVVSFDKAIQGQVAGVYAMAKGDPSQSSTFLIRGMSSINPAASAPLFIMDGVPISSEFFSSINPNDIETYTVLKDASATSIYGALAANGVILISTKRGKNMERSQVNYRFQLGTSALAHANFTMMDTKQRLGYEEDLGLRKLDPTGKYYISSAGLERKDSLLNINTNWRDELFRSGLIQSHEASLRGGSKNTKYFASLSYYDQEGIIIATGYKRMGMRLNLDHNLNDKLTVGLSSAVSHQQSRDIVNRPGQLNPIDPMFASYALLPYLKPRNDDGQLIDFRSGPSRNPLLYYELNKFGQEQVHLTNNVFAELKIGQMLKFKTNVGADYIGSNNAVFQSAEWNKDTDGSSTKSFGQTYKIVNSNLLTFATRLAEIHQFNILLGQETNVEENKGFSASVSGIPDDKIPMLDAGVSASASDYISKWALLSYFSQLSYNYANTYYLDLSLRRDGSSRFAQRWGNFWSVGGSWNMKRANFLKESSLISSLTLNASSGTSGNSSISAYEYMSTWTSGRYNNETGRKPYTAGNPQLRWEKVFKNNLGVDISFYNKYRFKVEGYINYTNHLLVSMPLALSSGYATNRQNVGQLSNKGVEFEWDLLLMNNQNLQWSFKGNMAYNYTFVESLSKAVPEIDQGVYRVKEGERYGYFYTVNYAGVDPLTGKPLWYDKEGNITASYNKNDAVRQNKSFLPKLTGGFGSDLSYKNFTASVFFSWVAGKYALNQLANVYNSNGLWTQFNQGTDMLNYWTKPGDISTNPHPSNKSNQSDTRYLENTSFLRLKNISLSYSLDPNYLKQIKLVQSARIYIQAQNLLTFTKYTGFDPEVFGAIDSNNYPQARAFSFGIDLTF